ncbi:MAG: hypothetical protein Fur0022_44600 [Anaerolineales bacterium]
MKILTSRFTPPLFALGLSVLLLCTFFASIRGPAHAQSTFTVTNTNNSGAGSLRQAINLANTTPGPDLIVTDLPGCTPATPCIISLGSELPTITETVSISGTGATSLIIDAGGTFRGLNIADVVVTLADLTIRNGYTPGNGAGIRTMGELFLHRVHLHNNVAGGDGGGAYVEGLIEVYEGLIEGNAAEGNGGGIYTEGNLLLQSSSLLNNTSEGDGGGSYCLQDTTVIGGSFEDNLSIGNGGGAYVSNLAVVTGTLFLSNTIAGYGYGGGLMTEENAIVYNTQFEGNLAESGGGLYAVNTLHLENAIFLRNETQSDNGGGAYAGGDVTVIGGRFEENTTGGSGDGGGLFGGGIANSSVSVTGTVFLNNTSGSAGAGSSGGGLFTYGNAQIENSWFENNFTDLDGGGVKAEMLDLQNTTFLNNTAGDGGGAYSEGETSVHGGLFEGNVSSDGGGLYVGASATLTDTIFSGNLAEYGGGLYVYDDVTIMGGVFDQNESTQEGGGGYLDGDAHVYETAFLNNDAGTDGGGLYVASAWLTGTTFLTNTAGEAGGGIYGITIQVSQGEFIGNASQYGGGVFSFNSLDLIDTYLHANTATEYGGGAYGIGYITIIASHFDQNTSDLNGGGLTGVVDPDGMGATEIVDTRFTSNTAPVGGGGAVQISSPFGALTYNLIIDSSTFLDNHADVGGGVYYTLGDGQIVNTLFARNTATTDGSSLGLYTYDTMTILHTTIVGDLQNPVSGIRFHNGFLDIYNTIFTQHGTAILNVNGTLEQDYNLFYQNTTDINGAFTGGLNTVDGDPHFIAPNQDDYHLAADSAALDEGTDMGVNVDIDGETRPFGPGFDIGYDEANPISGLAILYSPTPTITVGSTATFTATVTSGNGILYTWDFGDSSPDETGNPVPHIYTAPGLYTVTLTATNALGSVSTTVEIEVVEIKTPPITYPVFLPIITR